MSWTKDITVQLWTNKLAGDILTLDLLYKEIVSLKYETSYLIWFFYVFNVLG